MDKLTEAARHANGLEAGNAERVGTLRRALAGECQDLLIDGAWCPAITGRAFDIDDPATGTIIATAAAGEADDVALAVGAARRAFRDGPWPRLPASKRAALLFALADELEAKVDDLALLESLDAGHPLDSLLNGDIRHGLAALRDNAAWATKLGGETAMQAADQRGANYFLREPVGVVGIITPWNAPFLMTIQKLAAALAAGCTVVIKPSELAPLTAVRLGRACQAVGIPPGVVNIVTGTGAAAGQALAEHPDVNMISFTGSTATGRSIMASSARSNLKRVVLELGGKSPVLVFADTDLPKAAAAIVAEITFKSGQYCAAGSRVFVQSSVYGELLDLMQREMGNVRTGAGYQSGSDMGPMISERQRRRALDIIEHSLEAGARLLCGGQARPGVGYFFDPTIITHVTADMRVSREEIFAPVLVVTPFADDASQAEVADLANDSIFGLSAKVWARDVGIVHDMIARLEAGQVVVNGGGGEAVLPFGGVKQSGYGRENGLAGVSAYTEIKSVRLGY